MTSSVVIIILWILFVLTEQTCRLYNQSLQLCYQTQESSFIFVNCTRSYCPTNNAVNNTLNNSNCNPKNVTTYDQIECLSQLCPHGAFGTLSTCINSIEGNSGLSNKTVEIVCAVIGTVVGVTLILLLCYFLYRKFYLPKTHKNLYHPSTKIINQGQQNTFIPSNIDSSIIQIPSLSSNANIPEKLNVLENQANCIENDQTIIQMGYINNEAINQPCCICLSSQQINCLTQCNHFYHANCIIQWMKKQQSCPKCRCKNFIPIKIFCTKCGKVRDMFKFIHKRYACFSKIDCSFYTISMLCHQCKQSEIVIQQRRIKQMQVKQRSVEN